MASAVSSAGPGQSVSNTVIVRNGVTVVNTTSTTPIPAQQVSLLYVDTAACIRRVHGW